MAASIFLFAPPAAIAPPQPASPTSSIHLKKTHTTVRLLVLPFQDPTASASASASAFSRPHPAPVSPRFPSSLTTPRLLLRRLHSADAPALCAYRSQPEVARYQSWETFGPADAARLLDDQQDRDLGTPGTWLQVALVEAATGQLIGDCGLHCLADEPQQFEIGITLAHDRQRKGYATEALECLLHHLFTTQAARRLSATTDALNEPAAALFRRLGFRQEAHHIEHRPYKGTFTSEYVFALLAREWAAQSHPPLIPIPIPISRPDQGRK